MSEKTEYIYVNVAFANAIKSYSFRTNDESINAGDYVVVPVGIQNEETLGLVESVSKYTEDTAPYPVCKTKFVIRKASDDEIHKKNSETNFFSCTKLYSSSKAL